MILIAFGANLPSVFGSADQTLTAALRELSMRGIKVLDVSPVYLTEPVPASSQPLYRNCVARVETLLSPVALLKMLKQIERDFGRNMLAARNAARVIDLDLLAYGREVVRMNGLQVPHPRLHERGFVLYPLREVVASDWVHPVLGLSVRQMIERLPAEQRLDLEQEAA